MSDRNGAMDIIFAQCKSAKVSTGRGSDCSINVVYNQQAGLCSGATSQYERLVTYDHVKGQKQELHLKCRGTAQLCTADSAFDFDFDGDGEVSTRLSH